MLFLESFWRRHFYGVLDDGTVIGVPPKAASDMVKNFIKVKIYDRVDDADVKVKSTAAIAQMYIRKQNIFTEKKIYPYATLEDLRLDLLPKVRIMAQNHAGGKHSWTTMTDEELLKSAGLYGIVTSWGLELVYWICKLVIVLLQWEPTGSIQLWVRPL